MNVFNHIKKLKTLLIRESKCPECGLRAILTMYNDNSWKLECNKGHLIINIGNKLYREGIDFKFPHYNMMRHRIGRKKAVKDQMKLFKK